MHALKFEEVPSYANRDRSSTLKTSPSADFAKAGQFTYHIYPKYWDTLSTFHVLKEIVHCTTC